LIPFLATDVIGGSLVLTVQPQPASDQVDASLVADISGSGSVFYYGNPIVAGTISGSGRIVPLGS